MTMKIITKTKAIAVDGQYYIVKFTSSEVRAQKCARAQRAVSEAHSATLREAKLWDGKRPHFGFSHH